jgi:phosphatidate cytidylyltransferase
MAIRLGNNGGMTEPSGPSAFQFACLLTLALLVGASLVVFLLLKFRPKNETFKKVAVIVKSWWLIAGAFLLMLSWHKWGLVVGMAAFSLLALREYLKQSKVEFKRYMGFSLSVLCLLQYGALAVGNATLFFSLIPVLCLWVVPGLVIFRATIKNLELVVSVGFGLGLFMYYLSHLAALVALPQLHLSPEESTNAALILVLITWCNDIFQFISGKSFGKRKIVPEVSPNKTLAGFVGGILGSMILTGICVPPLLHFSLAWALLLGAVLGFTGMFGDLFFSAVKRNLGVKDFSRAIPGHGGLLDRLDSLIFTAPVYFHFLLFLSR